MFVLHQAVNKYYLYADLIYMSPFLPSEVLKSGCRPVMP